MTLFWSIFLFIIGAACGSFVGALVHRLKKGGRAWRDFWLIKGKYSRSVCEHCSHRLAVRDLIPIVSWLVLRGKCRHCRQLIGWSTLWLEIGIGTAFMLSYLFWPIGFATWVQIVGFVLWLVTVILMAALLVYDARWRILPNKLMWPLIGVCLLQVVISFVVFATHGWGIAWQYVGNIALALIPVFGVYLLLYLVSRGALVGLGDVRFGLVVALLLADWRLALTVLAFANLVGSLFVLPQLITKKLHAKSQIAFGPFLIIATYLTFLCAEPIVDFINKYLLLS